MFGTLRRTAGVAKRGLLRQWERVCYSRLLLNASQVYAEQQADYHDQPSTGLEELRFKNGRVFRLRDGPSGVRTFTEVFIKDLYPAHLLKNARAVVDVGANIGLASYYARLQSPQARILAFEADPSTFSVLSNNLDGLDIECRNVAAASNEGEISFFSSEVSGWSSRFRSRGASDAREVTVPAVKLSQSLESIPEIDFLKVDIEGAEYDVLLGDAELWDLRVNALAVEVDKTPRDPRYRFSDMVDMLQSRFASVRQAGHTEYPVFICQR